MPVRRRSDGTCLCPRSGSITFDTTSLSVNSVSILIFVYGVLSYNSYRSIMATKPLKTVGKKKQPAAVETSSSIEDKIKTFLESGGEIEQVKSGISGQPSMAPPKPKPAESKPADPKESS